MAGKLMLDTNVLIDLIRNKNIAIKRLQDYLKFDFVISYLVYAEIMAGAQLKDKFKTKQFLESFIILNFDEKAHLQATKYLNKYFTGTQNKPMDLLVAAHAKSLKMPILTNNSKDFIFSGLKTFYYNKS
jgi:tRNA(fMet)-specific endonuclease VapC